MNIKHDLELRKGTLHQITFDLQLYRDAFHQARRSVGSGLAELRSLDSLSLANTAMQALFIPNMARGWGGGGDPQQS